MAKGSRLGATRAPVGAEQIAAACGVSVMTVSRALRDDAAVADETRRAVRRAAERLGYRPNVRRGRPRLPAERERPTVDVVVSTAFSTDTLFYAQLLFTIERELSRRGVGCVVRTCDDSYDTFLSVCESLRGSRSIGLLAIGHLSASCIGALSSLARRLILVDHTETPGLDLPCEAVSFDNVEAARLAVRHLAAQGRRRILLLAGAAEHGFAREVARGYRDALAEHGLSADPALIRHGAYTAASAAETVAALLREGVAFDAVFTTDEMAFGALRALREGGRSVPRDVAVVGCDGLPLGEHAIPSLSTVILDFRKMGQVAVERLFDAQRRERPELSVRLLPVLEVRDSSRPPPGAAGAAAGAGPADEGVSAAVLTDHDPGCVRLPCGAGEILVCPTLGGRLFAALDNRLIHRLDVERLRRPSAAEYDNLGGNSLWPAPEGGRLALNYRPGTATWYVQDAVARQPVTVVSGTRDGVVIEKRIVLVNRANVAVPVLYRRAIAPLGLPPGTGKLRGVAYATRDELIPLAALRVEEALLAPWSLEQFEGCDGVVAFARLARPAGALNFDYYATPHPSPAVRRGAVAVALGGVDKFQFGVRAAAGPTLIGAFDPRRSLLVTRRIRGRAGVRFDIADNEQPRGPWAGADSYSVFSAGRAGAFHELETVGAVARRRGVLQPLPLVSETVALRGAAAELARYARERLGIDLEGAP